MAVILKSNKTYTGTELAIGLQAYKERVLADGGTINNLTSVTSAFLFAKQYGFSADNVISATSANWGAKVVDGNITKLYSLFGAAGDVVMTGNYPLTTVGDDYAIYTDASSSKLMSAEFSTVFGDVGVAMRYAETGTYAGTRYLSSLYNNTTNILRFALNDGVLSGYYGSNPVLTAPNVTRDGNERTTGAIQAGGKFYLVDSRGTTASVGSNKATVNANKLIVGGLQPASGQFGGNIFETWAVVGMSIDDFSKLVNR